MGTFTTLLAVQLNIISDGSGVSSGATPGVVIVVGVVSAGGVDAIPDSASCVASVDILVLFKVVVICGRRTLTGYRFSDAILLRRYKNYDQ